MTDTQSSAPTSAEVDAAVGKGKQGMVLAHADIGAGMNFGTALAHQDVAGKNALAAEPLHAETAPIRIAAITRRAACLLVSHT